MKKLLLITGLFSFLALGACQSEQEEEQEEAERQEEISNTRDSVLEGADDFLTTPADTGTADTVGQ